MLPKQLEVYKQIPERIKFVLKYVYILMSLTKTWFG